MRKFIRRWAPDVVYSWVYYPELESIFALRRMSRSLLGVSLVMTQLGQALEATKEPLMRLHRLIQESRFHRESQ